MGVGASRPVRARDLKLECINNIGAGVTSRPVRARDLKLDHIVADEPLGSRAPCGRVI